jgi:hypothetical protein
MTPDFRALCAELVETWDATADFDFNDFGNACAGLVNRASAALAEPVGEGPSDEEIDAFVHQWWEEYGKGYLLNSSDKALVAAALARWARPAAPPAPEVGEVGELVAVLLADAECLTAEQPDLIQVTNQQLTRAATLLQQLSAPAPVVVSVAVSERLPVEGDCDAEGRCWWFNPGCGASSNPHIATSSWRFTHMLAGKPMGSHWASAYALPLPQVEKVEG